MRSTPAKSKQWGKEPDATWYDLKQLAVAVVLFELVVAALAFATRTYFGVRTALWVGLGIGGLVLVTFALIVGFSILTHGLATFLTRRERRQHLEQALGMADLRSAADTRLASYGTLAPGQPNHHQLAELHGRWRQGTVRGWLGAAGWAAPLGYPGLVLDAAGPLVDVQLFESLDLPDHWSRLDEFEGPEYRRVVTQVCTADGDVPAWIYVIAVDKQTRRPR